MRREREAESEHQRRERLTVFFVVLEAASEVTSRSVVSALSHSKSLSLGETKRELLEVLEENNFLPDTKKRAKRKSKRNL